MKPVPFRGQQKILGAPEKWDAERDGPCIGLPVAVINSACNSYWMPTWRERLSLIFGAGILLRVMSGQTQPPVSIDVVQVPR